MVINYTDSDGNIITKTINSISGRLSKDYKAFYVDMSPVTKLIDGAVTSATVDLKLSGFVSSSEKQNGRPVKAFELSSLQVRPLYSTLSLDYSTVGFSTQSKILIPVKGAFSLAEGAYKLTAKDSSLNEKNMVLCSSPLLKDTSSIFPSTASSIICSFCHSAPAIKPL